MANGYVGKILRVDLAKKKSLEKVFDASLLRAYVGGSGLSSRVLYDQTDQNTDPLGPENLLIFMTGPFAATKVPLSGRHQVAGKSPLTGLLGESDVGGSWGVGKSVV